MILDNPNIDEDYWTTQQLREYAIWTYLELRAQDITAEWLFQLKPTSSLLSLVA